MDVMATGRAVRTEAYQEKYTHHAEDDEGKQISMRSAGMVAVVRGAVWGAAGVTVGVLLLVSSLLGQVERILDPT
jgi:hypothetical protein